LPISGLTFILLFVFLDVHNPRTRTLDGLKAIDWCGTLSFLGLALMVMLGLNLGGELYPWDSPKVISLLVVGAFMSVLLIFSEKKLARYPLIPLALFQDRSNVAVMLVTFLHGLVSCSSSTHNPNLTIGRHSLEPSIIFPYTSNQFNRQDPFAQVYWFCHTLFAKRWLE
jgi:hypothetical protein